MYRFENQCVHFLLVPASHVTMTSWVKDFCSQNLRFGLNRKGILCSSLFALKPIAGFCPFISNWRSKNTSRDHGINDEFVHLTKLIVLCTVRKRILCWSILVLEPKAKFRTSLSYWTSKNGSHDPDVKGNLLLMQNL